MLSTDLNLDVTEGGRYSDALPFVSSANIQCGSPLWMQETVREVRANCLATGSLLTASEASLAEGQKDALRAELLFQLGALDAFCRADGIRLRHVRLSGALSEAASLRRDVADVVVDAASRINPALHLLVPLCGVLYNAARMRGLRTTLEYDVTRGYLPDGSYAPATRIDAVLTDAEEAARRVLRMATHGLVPDVYGNELALCGFSTHISGVELAEQVYNVIRDSPVLLSPR